MLIPRNGLSIAYFDWMCDLVSKDKHSPGRSFTKLLEYLHDIEFTYIIPGDANRFYNGIDLRYRFAYERFCIDDAEIYLWGPCSVLEMMVALALKCEEEIMDDPSFGNRTSQWFWGMVVSLGLGSMLDDRFDERYVEDVIYRFLNREYEPDGKGGLFTVRHCDKDLREVEIWYQLCWYLDSFT